MPMSIDSGLQRLARRGSAAILAAFRDYQRQFQGITRRAKARFEHRDWRGGQRDAVERLELYGRVIAPIEDEVREILGATLLERRLWAAMKAEFSERNRAFPALELAETFFNSISRRIFDTVGVDPEVEFLSSDFDARPSAGPAAYRTYPVRAHLAEVVRDILADYWFTVAFENLRGEAQLVAEAIDRERQAAGIVPSIDVIEMIRWVFYRNKGAYLVGRVRCGDRVMPLVLVVLNEERGLVVDAALMSADEVSIIFSFTRSYFHVEVDRPRALVAFLKSIMPLKPTAELYNAIGYNKHGKTELYRELVCHIERSADRFEVARGDKGMVMIVFTLPTFDVVFKVIRDAFAHPKTTTRREVMDKYRLVSLHDRAGRLADVQEFEHLTFARDRFSDAILAELENEAAASVTVGAEIVHFKHLYTERRMVPLNLYLLEAEDRAACAAAVDYGQAVKDLAATNIFPGDMLLKNFGVTRQRRVIFYDYDELCLVTDCTFREMPQARDGDEEFASEPWFYVGPHDIFPEEFLTFLGLSGAPRAAFLQAHGDLLTPQYWRTMQARHRAGEVMDIIPYGRHRRLRPREDRASHS
jgi:isocitrate dehydrogenase kinase/phosphatase